MGAIKISSVLHKALAIAAMLLLAVSINAADLAAAEVGCQTAADIERENNFTSENRLGHYVDREARLYAETMEKELMSHEFDTVFVWGSPETLGGVVAVVFNDGCAIGHKFIGNEGHNNFAAVIEKYRQKGTVDIHEFLSPHKQNYYEAEAFRAEGKYDEAERLYKKALIGFKAELGPIAPSVNQILQNMATAYHAQGRHAEAEKFYQDALDGWIRSLGAGSNEEADVRLGYADLLRALDRDAEAANMEAQAKAIRP